MTYLPEDYELFHFGVKGMKWGVRKSEDATSTPKFTRAEKRDIRRKTKGDAFSTKSKVTADTIADIQANGSNSAYIQKRYGKNFGNTTLVSSLMYGSQKHRQKMIDKDLKELSNRKEHYDKSAEAAYAGKMTPNQKKVATGLAVTATIIAAYGSYTFVNTGEFNRAKMVMTKTEWKRKPDNALKFGDPDIINTHLVPNINKVRFKDESPAFTRQNNCRRCTFAYELTRRGYDVQATATVDGAGQTSLGLYNATNKVTNRMSGPLGAVTKVFVESGQGKMNQPGSFTDPKRSTLGGKPIVPKSFDPTRPAKGGYTSKDIFDALASQPEGARGELSMQWSLGGAHSMAWEIIKGKPAIFDTQRTVLYKDEASFEDVAKRMAGAGVTRLDNVDLNEDYLKRWVTNAK